MNNKSILIISHEIIQPWTKRDIEILKKDFKVKIYTFKKINLFVDGKINIIQLFKFILYRILDALKLVYNMSTTDLIFGWFVSEVYVEGVVISKLLGKKSIVVTGGYDIENIPEINYGLLQHPIMRRIVKIGLRKTDYILPYSKYTFELVKNLIGNKNNIRLMNLACDTGKFKPKEKKENIVITAGFIDDVYIKRKGFDTFVKAARSLPDIKFYLIGKQRDNAAEKLKEIAPNNLIFTGFVSDNELLEFYQRAKVFCLLSYQEGEGGGGVLGEAMSCGCVPVVSEKALALKETASDFGIYVPYGDVEATVQGIQKALESSYEIIPKIRDHIVKYYSVENREINLVDLVKNILNQN